MSTLQSIKSMISDNEVQQYLRDHADFFQTHSQLLSDLSIPHESGKAVSLVERQVSILREQKSQLKKQLRELVQIAKENDSLNHQLHKMTIELYKAGSVDDVIDVVRARLKSDYGIDTCNFVFFKGAGVTSSVEKSRVISRRAGEHQTFKKILNEIKPVCGRFNEDVTAMVFPDDAQEIKSIAMLPLADDEFFGVLSLGSFDAQRFHAAKATDFLKKLSELLSYAIMSHK